MSIAHNLWLLPTAFGAGMRGVSCLCFALVGVARLAKVGGG
jgi:hypothetical protein